MSYYITLLIISLLNVFSSVHAMDRILEIKDWDYKERKSCCLSGFCVKNRKLAYFPPQPDCKQIERSLLDELLFAKRIQEQKGIPKDVADVIVYHSYLIEKSLHKGMLKKIKNNLSIAPYTTLLFCNQDKQALLYIIEHAKLDQNIMIEGLDKHFAQKMSQRICELPIAVRQKITKKYGPHIMCNTKYELTLRNILLGDDDESKDCLANASGLASCGYCGYVNARMVCCIIPTSWLWRALYNIALFSTATICRLSPSSECERHFFGFMYMSVMIAVLLTGYGSLYSYEMAHRFLKETEKEKNSRLGFESIPLLQEMDCNFIEL